MPLPNVSERLASARPIPQPPIAVLHDASVRPYWEAVRRDAPFHVVVAVYAFLAMVLGLAAGVPHKFAPFSYLLALGDFVFQVLLLLVAAVGLWSLPSGRPIRALRAAARKGSAPEAVAGLLLIGSLSIYLCVFTSIKTMLTDVVPFFADPFLADLDKLLHGGDVWQYTNNLMRADFTPVLEHLYFGAWGVLLPASLAAAVLAPRLRKVRTQYVWTLLLAWPLLGNVVAAAGMSAGPVYYDLVTGSTRFAPLVDYLAQHSIAQHWQAYLWKSYLEGHVGAGLGISAFPSLHVANATLFVLLANRIHPWLRWAAVVFAAVILFGSVHLGWHYAVDGYFSIAATILIWKVVGWRLAAAAQRAQRHRAADTH